MRTKGYIIKRKFNGELGLDINRLFNIFAKREYCLA